MMSLKNTRPLSYFAFLCLILVIFSLSSCVSTQPGGEKVVKKDFVVIAGAKDTLASLAKRYLNNASMGNIIGEYNHINSVSAGQKITIPLQSFNPGGVGKSGFQTVPVLLYHRIENSKASSMVVTTKNFKQQMQFLKDNDYHVISMDQLLDYLELKTSLPPKSVVITFDDGWSSVYKNAYPILKSYGYPATVFLYTDFIGGGKALKWEQVKELSKNGFDMQCHSQSHRNLSKSKGESDFKEYFNNLHEEITGASEIISKRINKKVDLFAYPYGIVNSPTLAILEKNGYRAAFTVKRGGNPNFSNKYTIKRSMIYGNFSLKQFKKNLMTFNVK